MFVEDGVRHGRRNELVGGGIQRMRRLMGEGIEAADERILGNSDFVESLRGDDPAFSRTRKNLNDLVRRTADALKVDEADLLGGSRVRNVAEARSVISFLATREYGVSGEELGRVLRISRSGVCRAARRGQEIVRENRWLMDLLRD
jgi:chromosomal replication initiation ATPase DnaA